MSRISHVAVLSLATLLVGSAAGAAGYGETTGTPTGPKVLLNGGVAQMDHAPRMKTVEGMSLYFFDRDSPGMSNCNGACAVEWPPMKAPSTAVPSKDFSVIRRNDGSRQWAWMGKPLYLFQADKVAGDAKGGSYSPEWHLATSR